MMADKHPSGRPIRNQRVVGKTIWRIPDKGSVIPRLQDDKKDVHAIGFTAQLVCDDD